MIHAIIHHTQYITGVPFVTSEAIVDSIRRMRFVGSQKALMSVAETTLAFCG